VDSRAAESDERARRDRLIVFSLPQSPAPRGAPGAARAVLRASPTAGRGWRCRHPSRARGGRAPLAPDDGSGPDARRGRTDGPQHGGLAGAARPGRHDGAATLVCPRQRSAQGARSVRQPRRGAARGRRRALAAGARVGTKVGRDRRGRPGTPSKSPAGSARSQRPGDQRAPIDGPRARRPRASTRRGARPVRASRCPSC
jgi:hypothetical protein